MNAGLGEFGHEVLPGHIAIVTGETIVGGNAEGKQALMCAGIVGRVAILTTVIRHSVVLGLRPGVQSAPVPGFGRVVMRSGGPGAGIVTFDADRRPRIIHHKKVPELIVVRIMASGALQLAGWVQANRRSDRRGRSQLDGSFRVSSDFVRQRAVVKNGNRMIIRQVGAKHSGAGKSIGDAILHGYGRSKAIDHAQSHRAIMATQAKLGRACRLAGGGLGRGAAVWRISRGGKRMIPEWGLADGTMRRMAENTNLFLGGGFGAGPAGDREIVFRADH